MAIATDFPGLRPDMEHAVEIVPPHWVGDEELIELSQRYDDLLTFERFADGTLLVSPLAGWRPSGRDAEIVRQVANWVRRGDRGLVLGGTGGVHLPDHSLFGPDATYVSRERFERMDKSRTFAETVPDAAFEVLSPSDRVRSTLKKIDAYLRNGVRLVVLIDPMRLKVYVGREGDEAPRDLGNVDELDCSPVMPGFVLDIAAIRNIG